MDLSGLTAVTTASEMKAWLSANCLSPISPVMTGTDLGVIMQKVIDVTEAGSIGAAGNGLTLNGSEVDLGGTLDQDTTINLATQMLQFLGSDGGSLSTTYQQRYQPGHLGGPGEAAINIEAAGPTGSSGIDMNNEFMNVGYFTSDGKQNMIAFSPDGLTFSANDNVWASLDSSGVFNTNKLNVTGAVNLPVTSVTTNYTVTDTDYKLLIRYDGTSSVHITLPDPTTVPGRVLVVQNMNPGTNGIGRLGSVKFSYDIATNQGQTITANTGILLTGNMTIELQSDGTVWTGIVDQSHSIPAGGTANQLLSKIDDTDYNVSWTDASFAALSGAPADNAALAGALSAKADLSAGLIPFSELPNNIIDILYADLVTAIGASTLRKGQYYRITDFQTTHNIIGSSPTTLNTGAVEPLIVFAITASKLSPIAYSETWPGDIIYYTTANTAQSGASKGVILRRIDTVVNVDVCNDFRNVKYRRWALAPAAWNSGTAYAHGAVVQYTDGAIYFVNAQSGVSAGDIPSATSDNWAQLFPDNTQNYGRSTSNLLIGVNQVSSSVANPTVPNAGTFTDNYMFQGYDNTTTKYKDVFIGGDPGQLVNLVVYAYSGVTAVMNRVRIGQYASGVFTTTFCVTAGSIGFQDIDLPQGINSCVLVVGALGMTQWSSPIMCFNSFFNITQFGAVTGGFGNCFIRGTMLYSSFNRLSFTVTPNLVHNLRSDSVVGGYFCMSSASLKNVTIIGSGDVNYAGTNDVTQQNQRGAGVWVTSPLVNKIFFGLLSLDESGSGSVQAVVTQSAINRAAYRKIIYVGEDQPAEKTIVKITSGSPLVVTWQTDLTPFNANNDYISAGDSATISTYFSRHGNDFQVQQRDLISGVWTPNNSPAYTIDSVDGSGNVTQVTLHPNTASGVTESRFIIV
ncbi:MAG: hypothetical protein JST50_04785 [Bacteroidetes bacterium]|jgi:hypothetical protein|nr:hypothetical protein [Bacteroidota bacterium]